ncbi:MAG TPA: hypothetical protein VHN37_08065 [Actinomycetota bacterium]|nr:hypothetical protein [Actinomycetota bacterium]
MILARKRAVAVFAAAVVVASGAMWAPAAQAAPTCVDVPGETVGAWVKVGPVNERIPAVSGIRLCAGGVTAPLYRVETAAAGGCNTGCLTVYVGGPSIGVEGATISWREDDVEKSAVIEPREVTGTGEVCVLSTGIPLAPDPACFIALGIDDPTGLVAPVVDAAEDAVEDAGEITCTSIPDWYDPSRGEYVDFCTDPAGWSAAVANDGGRLGCSAIPPMYDDWGNAYYFCDNASAWTNALIDETYDTCNNTIGYQVDPNTWQPVYFCDDPVRWTQIQLENLCRNLCDVETLQELIARIRVIISRGIEIRIG